jgi:MFS transporter, DHA3 family, tetracycline resistance protein
MLTRRFRGLLAVRGVSTVCTGLTTVVTAWLVLAIGGTAFDLAVLAALSAGAGILAVFWCGPLIDRYPRRTVAMATEFARIAGVGAVPLLAALGELRLWEVLAAGAWVAAAHAVSVAAYGAILPELMDRDQMMAANGIWQSVSQVGVFAGAALGGLTIGVFGAANALLVDVAGRVLAGAGLVLLRWPAPPRPATPARGLGARDMTQAWQVLRQRPVLLWITLFGGVPGSLIWGVNAVLPVFVKTTNGLDAAQYGVIDATWGVGAFAAGLLCVRLPALRRGDRQHVPLLAATGVAMIALGLVSGFVPLLAAAAVVGGASLAALVAFQSYVQAESPAAYTGRILATAQLMLSALWLLVALGVGALTFVLSVRTVIIGWGLAIVASGVVLRLLLRAAAGRQVVPSVPVT